ADVCVRGRYEFHRRHVSTAVLTSSPAHRTTKPDNARIAPQGSAYKKWRFTIRTGTVRSKAFADSMFWTPLVGEVKLHPENGSCFFTEVNEVNEENGLQPIGPQPALTLRVRAQPLIQSQGSKKGHDLLVALMRRSSEPKYFANCWSQTR